MNYLNNNKIIQSVKYGGNPVSMAAANAVLDVIEKEKLYTHVSEVSKFLLNELEKLKLKHEIIGDIRFVVVWEINF